MSADELNRLEILGRVLERRLSQAQAAEQLGLVAGSRPANGSRVILVARRKTIH